MNLDISTPNPGVTLVEGVYTGQKWEQWFLLTSDHHWDNPKCDRNLLESHHKKAIERNAAIMCFGDLFCAMQGKYDKRKSKEDLRPEHQSNKYLDSLVNTAIDWYSPYANNYALISYGNHETSITSRHETDLIERLVSGLNRENKANISKGTYGGWVVFKFRAPDKSGTRTLKLWYHHGSGGGGPVTKGVIQTNRRSDFIPNADLVVSGHVHERWELSRMKEDVNTASYQRELKEQLHIQLPTYKEEYLKGSGWHVERGAPPKPLGGCWLRLFVKSGKLCYETNWAR